MEPMVRPESWNRRNRLMNRQWTVWNRPESKPEPERLNQVPHGTGARWNRNRNGTGPTRTVAVTIERHFYNQFFGSKFCNTCLAINIWCNNVIGYIGIYTNIPSSTSILYSPSPVLFLFFLIEFSILFSLFLLFFLLFCCTC